MHLALMLGEGHLTGVRLANPRHCQWGQPPQVRKLSGRAITYSQPKWRGLILVEHINALEEMI